MTDKTFLTEENPDKSIPDMMDPNWCEECGKVCECAPQVNVSVTRKNINE